MQCVVVVLCIIIKLGSRSNWLRKSRFFVSVTLPFIFVRWICLNIHTHTHSPMFIFKLVPFFLCSFSLNLSQWSFDNEMAAGWKELCKNNYQSKNKEETNKKSKHNNDIATWHIKFNRQVVVFRTYFVSPRCVSCLFE